MKKAKVSLSAVKSFEQAVAEVRDYSPQFEKGISCLDGFWHFLFKQVSALRENIENLQNTQNSLADKIRESKAEIARHTEKLNELEDKKLSFERDLSGVPESFTVTDDKGKSYNVPNPSYAALKTQIAAVEGEIITVKAELLLVQQRLEHANSVNSQLASHIDVINEVINSLKEKQKSCVELKAELEEIKNLNLRKGTIASENLKKIEAIVVEYLHIRMRYENAAVINSDNVFFPEGVKINVNINETVVQEQRGTSDVGLKKTIISAEEIAKHQIKFDESGRICQYDNKTWGGKYNSYEIRLSRTPLGDNPMLGYYDGDRGESKFIPSGRIVEGVIVKGILKNYGLDGIEYRNAEPDFEVCSEAVVKIKAMSENRENYIDSNGIQASGNFSQADIACAKLWNLQRRGEKADWSGRDIFEYRKANGLTWHEKCDMETMVLVRSEINLFFKHSGGCSECRVRNAGQNGGDFDA